MMQQLLMILINLATVLVLNALPDNWCMFYSFKINVIISSLFITILFHFDFELLWEMKSFIFNVFQLFNIHASSRVIEELKNEKKVNT